jgi:hypothetical protein
VPEHLSFFDLQKSQARLTFLALLGFATTESGDEARAPTPRFL